MNINKEPIELHYAMKLLEIKDRIVIASDLKSTQQATLFTAEH